MKSYRRNRDIPAGGVWISWAINLDGSGDFGKWYDCERVQCERMKLRKQGGNVSRLRKYGTLEGRLILNENDNKKMFWTDRSRCFMRSMRSEDLFTRRGPLSSTRHTPDAEDASTTQHGRGVSWVVMGSALGKGGSYGYGRFRGRRLTRITVVRPVQNYKSNFITTWSRKAQIHHISWSKNGFYGPKQNI
jgi:hypothetical protein